MDNKAYEKEFGINTDALPQKKFTVIKTHTFEEAVNLQGHGKFHYILFLVCGMCVAAYITETMGVSIIMISAKCDLGFSLYEQGFLASAGFLGVVLSSHAMGFFSDTCGRVKTLRYSVLMSTTFSIISAFSVSVWMLSAMRFLVGVFITGCQSTVFGYLSEFHGNKTRSKYTTLLSSFFTIGGTLIPAIAIGILPIEMNNYIGDLKFSSWRLVILLNSLPTFIALITLPFCPESPKYLLVQGKHDEALEVLRTNYSLNTGNSRNQYPVKQIIILEDSSKSLKNVKGVGDAIRIIWAQTAPLFNRERVFKTLNISFHQFIIFFVSHGTFMWLPGLVTAMTANYDKSLTICQVLQGGSTNKNSSESSSESECSLAKRADIFMLEILLLMGVFFTFLYILFAVIIDRVGKKRLLAIWMCVSGLTIFGLIWAQNFYLNMALLILLIGFGNCAGIVTTIASSYFPTNINSMGLCLMMMLGRLGAFTGSNVIGIILSSSCESLFIMFGCFAVLLLCLSYFLPEFKNKNIGS